LIFLIRWAQSEGTAISENTSGTQMTKVTDENANHG